MTSKRQQQEEAGRWLRTARERRGLHTAGALARRMGVSDSLVSRIETGATAVTDERAEQIAAALGMDVVSVRRQFGLWVPDSSDSGLPDDPDERAAALRAEADRLDALADELDAGVGDIERAQRLLARANEILGKLETGQ